MAAEEEGPVAGLGQVQALHLAPGDTLVVHLPGIPSDATVAYLKTRTEEAFPGCKVLVLGEGMSLSTITPAGGQLDRIEAALAEQGQALAMLVQALADGADAEDTPGPALDGSPSGAAREPGTPL